MRMILGILPALMAAFLLLFGNSLVQRTPFSYTGTQEAYDNPMMGFAPNADYVEAVGTNTLVYVDVTWRELEPQEGIFDFATIEQENYLDTWRAQGKQVVFRFVLDKPRSEAHMDIPDWLYEKTGDGTFYDCSYGKGYSPNYANETLIAYHEKAIEALGRQYGQDAFFCYIELGSIGHWGEWHVNYEAGIERLPGEDVLRCYVEPYLSAFPNAKCLMRRPFTFVSDYGLGVFNDMTGEPESTQTWLSWITEGGSYTEAQEVLLLPAVPDVWKSAPVGGEFTSSLSMEEMMVTQQARTLELQRASHMTFIGPKCPTANEEALLYPEETAAIKRNLGYRIGITQMIITHNKLTNRASVTMEVTNRGVAPMYFDWPLMLYLLDESGAVLESWQTDMKLTELAGGDTSTTKVSMSGSYLKDGTPRFAVGIVNPETGEPAVYLDMDVKTEGMRYLLCE